MKRFSLIFFSLIYLISPINIGAENKLTTSWGENISENQIWQEYPRPIMERDKWSNLNGYWEYTITESSQIQPTEFSGKIRVPFAIESQLSGVEKRLDADKALWYKRDFKIPSQWKDQNIILHFGAVDWQADVWVNNIKVGCHKGGFTPFSFDITSAINANGTNTIVVRVLDSTDKGFQPRGKQVTNPEGIWYTPVSGIWQTVWLEPVNKIHIRNIKSLPDIDRNTLTVNIEESNTDLSVIGEVVVYDNGKEVACGRSINNQPIEIQMPKDVKYWSPDSPFLYDLSIRLFCNGKVVDEVESYAAMRKYSMKRDSEGIVRFQLNNKDIFQFGPLDQGWWPDGLYTAPNYEAMVYDIKKTKEWGFNMIRKHVKVEPALWYAYCDRIGMIVWQDMPSGEMCCEWQNRDYFKGSEFVRTPESEYNYRQEWKEIIDCLYSYPCIAMWIPFNEAWGQFKTKEITEWTKQYDPSRLVNPASGGNFFTCGDVLDLHHYPEPKMYLYDAQRANVLGEYGGIGYPMKGHLWTENRNWGYIQFKSTQEVTDEYVRYGEELLKLIKQGFTGAVYTQTTDVEVEVNGIMTYDRKVVKMDEARIKEMNERICKSLNK